MAIRSVTVFQSNGARPFQEDHVIAHRDRGIFIVSDGFGGPISGAQAAKAACEEVRGFLFKEAGDQDATLPFVLRSYLSLAGNVLFNALVHANRKLINPNRKKNANDRGGASVIAGYLDGTLLALANVGACEAWLFRAGRMAELVIPRSYARMRNPTGETSAESEVEMQAPLIALGLAEDLEPEIFEYQVQAGDWLLLHTDGVSAETRAKLLALHQEIPNTAPDEAVTEDAQRILGDAEFAENASIALIVF
jgi:serine/threonine protein phosphatase PrpC